jgi:L-galactose dehydrogenase/L-glyceraldehyde 3-phosphate reductase
MKYRTLGRTGIQVSEIGYGCGAVGGLMVKGDRTEMLDAVKLAIDSGITYFDTARLYGNGVSETNIGWALKELNADVVLGTKVKLEVEDMADIESAVVQHVEGSLQRMGRDSVDLVSLHHPVGPARDGDRLLYQGDKVLGGGIITAEDVDAAARGFATLMQQGKTRFWGMNAVGDTDTIHQCMDSAKPFGMQAAYNLLNPSGSNAVPSGYPFQDYRQHIKKAADDGIGVFAIRVLAGGALSGISDRHENASPPPAPMGSSGTYQEDLDRSSAFRFLVEDGYVGSLVEAAIRFSLNNEHISTSLIGIANIEQLQQAIEFGKKGPLPAEAIEKLEGVWAGFAN